MKRRTLITALGAGTLAQLSLAQSYPARPIKYICPWPAGGSTDVVMRSLAESASKALGQQVVVENKTGAGGRIAFDYAAKSPADGSVVALIDAGATEIRLANRTRAKAEALLELGPAVRVVEWTQRDAALEGAGLVVNTTTLGMGGQPPLELDLKALPGDAVVNDIVYSPLETPLLAATRARGNAAVDGLGMLLHQARPAFHAFFGLDPAVTPALRAHVLGD